MALKFLNPEAIHATAEALMQEVRLARQITHPNVARVHDIGEW